MKTKHLISIITFVFGFVVGAIIFSSPRNRATSDISGEDHDSSIIKREVLGARFGISESEFDSLPLAKFGKEDWPSTSGASIKGIHNQYYGGEFWNEVEFYFFKDEMYSVSLTKEYNLSDRDWSIDEFWNDYDRIKASIDASYPSLIDSTSDEDRWEDDRTSIYLLWRESAVEIPGVITDWGDSLEDFIKKNKTHEGAAILISIEITDKHNKYEKWEKQNKSF